MAKKPPPKTVSAKRLPPLSAPPLKAFLRLLVDPEQDAALKRLLTKYRNPEIHHKLLCILQQARYSHQLRMTLSNRVSRSRKWFTKRDRWRDRIDLIDRQLDELLRDFQKTIYPLLRASKALPIGYEVQIESVYLSIERLKNSVEDSAILSTTFTTRGHQPQPYLKIASAELRRLKITGADANELLSLIGVKPDPFA